MGETTQPLTATTIPAETTTETATTETATTGTTGTTDRPLPRRRVFGLRLRLLGWAAVLLTVATLFSLVAVRQVLVGQLEARVVTALREEAADFQRLADQRDPSTGRPYGADLGVAIDRYLVSDQPQDDEAVFTFLDGRRYRSTEAPPADLADRPDLVRQWTSLTDAQYGRVDGTPAGPARWLAVPILVNGETRGHFVVAQFTGPSQDSIDAAVGRVALACLLVLVLAAVGGYAAMGRALRPLRTVTETAREIEETDLSQRIEVGGADEVGDLARTFNAMLDRLERAFAAQRAFVSDAGHELRTPITVVRGHLEVMGDDPDERGETVALVTDELDRMNRMVDDLLVLAKAEQPDFLHLEEVDAEALIRDVFAKATALGDRDWRLGAVAGATLRADRQRLVQALMQLVQNAVQYTDPGDAIEVSAVARGDRIYLSIRDTGAGIEPEDRARIFERFARGEAGRARSDGSGLGLAIVRAIAEAHRGTVVVDSVPGTGSTFTLVIPLHWEVQR